MKKILILLMLFITGTANALTYDQANYDKYIQVALQRGRNDPIRNFIGEMESVAAGGERGTGTDFYVDSGVSSAGAGTSWTAAVATLQEGINLCTDNAGDYIHVAQGHAENLASAAILLFDCPGITVIGYGSGDEMPEFSLTALASTVSVTSPDITIFNLRFLGDYANGSTLGLDVQATGDGFRVIGCEFRSNTSDEELLIALNVTALAHNLVIAGNSFVFETGGDESSAIVFEGASNKTVVYGNRFDGDWGDYVILGTNASSVQMLVADNTIHNLDGTSGKLISFNAATTGDIIHNICYGVGNSQAIVANAMFVSPDNVTMTTQDVETRTYEAMMGSFTGATGAGQGASLYADIVLAQADLDAILADFLDYQLDTVAGVSTTVSADGNLEAHVIDKSVFSHIMTTGADTSNYLASTMSLQALNTDLDAILVDTGTDTPAAFTTITNAIVAMNDSGYTGNNTAASQTTPVVALLAGFGDDYFNVGWSMICTLNADSVGNAPEGEIRDITNYVSLDGTFTVHTFSAALASGDQVMIKRTEELELDNPTILKTAGTVRYVDSGASTGDSTGLTWENAYDTLVIAEAASSTGDIIYIADGHNEAWTQAAQPVIDVTNLTIIGLGEGDARPLFDFDGNTTLVLTINAPGITIKNLRFNPSASAIAKGVHFEELSDGSTMENCSFIEGEQTNDEFVDAILLDHAAEQITIKNCTFENAEATAGAGATFVNLEDTPVENVSIIGCEVFGDFSDACIFWGAGVPVNLLLKDNILTNVNTEEMCIEGTGAATGMCVGNRLYSNNPAKILDPGSLKCTDNYASSAINTAGFLIPPDNDDLVEYGTGQIIYCDSGLTTAGDGRSWGTAVKSLLAAEALCSDDRGDTIYIAAGHSEATLSTEYADLDVGGLTVIGLGNGDLRPTFSYSGGAGGTLSIDNDDITIKNLHFVSAVNIATVGVTVKAGAENVRIEDCQFSSSNPGTNEFVHCIDHAAANHNFVIKNNRFQMGAGADAVGVLHFENSDYSEIVGNVVYGDYSTACFYNDTTASIHMLIKDNTMFNGTVGGIAGLNTEPCIELTNDTTGVITDNTLVCDVATPEASIVGADMFLARNTYSEIESTAGSRLIGDDQSIDVDIAALVGKGAGQVWYVDNTASGEDGRSWASAFATLNAAVTACTADVGDVVLVAEGHAEILTGADAVDITSKAGITIMGLGTGNARPRFDFSNAAAEIVIGSADVTIKNIQLRPGATAVLVAIDIEAGGLNATIENVAFLDGEASTTDEFIDGIVVHSTATGVTVKDCTYKTLNVTNADVKTFVNLDQGACVDTTITGNVVYGDFSEAPIWGAAQVCLNLNIHDNILTNVNTAEGCIEFSGAATGMCTNNLMYGDTKGATTAAILDPGSMKCFGNKTVTAINSSGEDTPLIPGKSYVRVMAGADVGALDELFTVAGSPIMITSFVGHCTVAVGGATTLNIQVNATAAAEDYDLSTDVDVQTVDQGGLIVFSNAILEGVTTPAPLGATGAAAMPLNWFVVPGVIESDPQAGAQAGDITWYMVFTPLGAGCSVVAM